MKSVKLITQQLNLSYCFSNLKFNLCEDFIYKFHPRMSSEKGIIYFFDTDSLI